MLIRSASAGGTSSDVCAPPTYCNAGAAITACDTVLVVCADTASYCADVQSRLQTTGAFSTVDVFRADSATPSASQLAAYHAVLAYSALVFADATLLGDRLAAYHDQGGGVVVAFPANTACCSWRLRGAFGTPSSGYALMDYAQGGDTSSFSTDSLGDALEPQSPLLYGVSSLAASDAHRSSAPVVAGRGVVVARWRGGDQAPLVLRGTKGGRTLVELNFFPVSSSTYSGGWTGDGAVLLRNGLKYSRCMPCTAGTYAMTGDGEGGWGRRVRNNTWRAYSVETFCVCETTL